MLFRSVDNGNLDVRFGSLADLSAHFSLMSGFERKAVIREPVFKRPRLNVCFPRKRTIRSVNIEQN